MQTGISFADVFCEIDAVLFDLDGVLLDTEPLYTQATKTLLGERAEEFTWEIKRDLMGRSALESARVLVERLALPFSPEDFTARKSPILHTLFPSCQPRPGARRFVEHCHTKGLRIAVATSSRRTDFECKVQNHDWFSLFDAVVCSSDPEVKRHKPAPDIFLVAARALGVPIDRCAIFEDSVAGVQAASRAGAKVVIALPDDRMDRAGVADATWVLSSFEDISIDEPLPSLS